MIRFCLLVLFGGFAAQHNRVQLSSDLITLLLVSAVLLFFNRRARLASFILLGFILFVYGAQAVIDQRLDERFAGDSLLTTVRIIDFPKISGVSTTMIVEPVEDRRLPPRSRISWYEATQVPSIGDIWELEVRLRRPHGSSNPGGFDLEAWMFREKIHAAGYVVNGKRNRLLVRGALPWRDDIRDRFVTTAQHVAPTPEVAAVVAAIAVGTRHLTTREQWERYAITGTSHLMAISGLHVGLVAAVTFAFVAGVSGLLRLSGNHLDHAIVAGFIAASMYALVSGLEVPSRRATIMLLIGVIGFAARRRVCPIRLVAVAALVVFIGDPVSSMLPGFSLSFGAVVVLIWTTTALSRPASGRQIVVKVSNNLRRLVALQGALLFGLLPLTVLMFNRVALLAPAVNLLVVPVFSIITVPATLVAMLLGGVSAVVAAGLLRLSAASIEVTEKIIAIAAGLPLADITPAGLDGRAACLLVLPLLGVILPRQWPGRPIAALGVVAIVLFEPATPPLSCFDAHVLDVGQGLATVVLTQDHAVVFDTGAAYRSGSSAAASVVLPFLRYKGINRIDRLIVSHADNDHAGGVSTLIEDVSIGRVIAGEPLPAIPFDVDACAAGQVWQVDGVEFNVLHPAPGNLRDGNDASCVLRVAVGEHALLLTGDIESRSERELVRHGAKLSSDVVVVPHHGSLTSSTPGLIKKIQADIAIASAGYRNRWGFPKPQVVQRWAASGARVLRTAESGAISLRLCADGGNRQLRQHRLEQARFWRDLPGKH